MITIKIECGCGQHYAFDVEPVDGHMPSVIACPACGADGTPAANAVIAQSVPAPARVLPAVAVAGRPAPVVRAAPAPVTATPSPRPASLLPGQTDRATAENEARAKVFWGDRPEEVIKFLMRQGVPYGEAAPLVTEFFQERCAAIRSGGIGKIITGVLMVCVPIAGWIVFARVGVIPLKLFAILVMIGLWGAWRVLKGTIMAVSPTSEPGDVADK